MDLSNQEMWAYEVAFVLQRLWNAPFVAVAGTVDPWSPDGIGTGVHLAPVVVLFCGTARALLRGDDRDSRDHFPAIVDVASPRNADSVAGGRR